MDLKTHCQTKVPSFSSAKAFQLRVSKRHRKQMLPSVDIGPARTGQQNTTQDTLVQCKFCHRLVDHLLCYCGSISILRAEEIV